jgi:hypothetical protein
MYLSVDDGIKNVDIRFNAEDNVPDEGYSRTCLMNVIPETRLPH